MKFIDKNLMDGEQIIYRTKLHWIVFLGPIILFVIGIFASYKEASAVGGISIFLAIIWVIAAAISRVTSEFGISNNRVLIKVGWIKRNSLETLLTKVEGIQVEQGILGRILNFGTIIVRGTGGTHNPFKKIADPFTFRKIAQEQISKAQTK
jgi:uncharacterized membrane protein YdbT with pleckstrin-like domain